VNTDWQQTAAQNEREAENEFGVHIWIIISMVDGNGGKGL